MRATWLAFAVTLFIWLIPLSPPLTGATPVAVSREEASYWQRWLLPLPHEIRLDRKIVVPRGRIAITLRPGAGPVEQQAAQELIELVGAAQGDPLFTIFVGIQEPSWRQGALTEARRKRLGSLPNRDQAYVIVPASDSHCC